MALIEVVGVVPDGGNYGPGVPVNPRQAIRMTQGTDVTVRMRLFHPGGAPVDIVNVSSTHVLSIKKNPQDVPALVSRAGAPQPSLGINVVDFVLSPNDTRLLVPEPYGWDVFSTINTVRDATIPLSPWKIEPAIGTLNAPVTSVSLVPLTIFGLPLNGLPGNLLSVTSLNPFTVGWTAGTNTKTRVAITTNIAITGIPAPQDGVTLGAGDVVLLTGQTNPIENGLQTVASGAWTRPSSFAAGLHATATLVGISEGTVGKGKFYTCNTGGPADVVDTDPLSFVELAGRALAVGTDGAVDVESPAGTLGARRRLTEDDIDPAFNITSFAVGFTNVKELGDTIVNPSPFSASYNAALTTPLTLGDGTFTDAIALAASTSFGYNNFNSSTLPARTYVKTAINATVTWTLSAKKSPSGPTKTATVLAAWRPRVFRGLAVLPGAYDEAFIEGLASSALQSSFAGTYVFGSGGGTMRIYLCWPTAFGGSPTIKDQNGFTFPMTKVATAVPGTNAFGVTWGSFGGYDVWESGITVVPFTLTVT